MFFNVHGAETFRHYNKGHKTIDGRTQKSYENLVKCMCLGADRFKNMVPHYEDRKRFKIYLLAIFHIGGRSKMNCTVPIPVLFEELKVRIFKNFLK